MKKDSELSIYSIYLFMVKNIGSTSHSMLIEPHNYTLKIRNTEARDTDQKYQHLFYL